jgi:glutamyl-tRNA synthetase
VYPQSEAIGDACLRTLVAGNVIQFERKGFFRVDKAYGGSPDKPIVLIAIPDGKATTPAPAAAAGAAKKEKN